MPERSLRELATRITPLHSQGTAAPNMTAAPNRHHEGRRASPAGDRAARTAARERGRPGGRRLADRKAGLRRVKMQVRQIESGRSGKRKARASANVKFLIGKHKTTWLSSLLAWPD